MSGQLPVGRDEMEVAHEALIRRWPRLGRWLDEDRAALRLRQELGQAAGEWERHGRGGVAGAPGAAAGGGGGAAWSSRGS